MPDSWWKLIAAFVAAVVWLVPAPAQADGTRDGQWYLDYLNVQRAHEISQGEGITVAVLDTGVDGSHPDLEGSVLPGLDAYASVVGEPSSDGWNDGQGHGTGVAGVLAGHGHGADGGDGVLGIAPKVTILPIKVWTLGESGDDPLGDLGRGPEAETAMNMAIDEALAQDVDIISMSLGGMYPERLQDAIDAGKIVVASVGNAPESFIITAPPDVVTVGSVGADGTISDFSVRGQGPDAAFGKVWLTAPGDDIVTTGVGGGYETFDGTSFATPIVAGAAALVWSKHPELSGPDVIDHLVKTSVDKGVAGQDEEYGFGDLDLVKALETVPTPTTTTPTTVGCGPCLPPTVDPDEADEAAAGEATSDSSGSDTTRTAAMAAAGAGLLVAAGFGLGFVKSTRLPALAGPGVARPLPPPPGGPAPGPPGPMGPGLFAPPPPPARPRRNRTLAALAVVGLVVAVGAGGFALTQEGDGGDTTGSDEATTTTEFDRSGLPVGGPPTNPPTGDPDLDPMTQPCLDGEMQACDDLYWEAGELISPEHPLAYDYQLWGKTCGGRIPEDILSCVKRLADS